MKSLLSLLFLLSVLRLTAAPSALVFQSDFGLGDGAVSAMQGVAYGVSPELKIFDLTHEVPPYDIWFAALTLKQTAAYWPAGTVFVSVVDPGVGTERKSVVLKTESGHYFVTPDNGTLTFVAAELGVAEVREIDEAVNRRKESGKSYTFHGRDVYAYTGARLASETIRFEEVGPELDGVLSLPYQAASVEAGVLKGSVFKLDVRYGNVWTNISGDLLDALDLDFGGMLEVTISKDGTPVFQGILPYSATFGAVPEGEPLVYLNSLLNVSFALNMGSFAEKHGIGYGSGWTVALKKQD
ncbi:SAM hydrolase/SAM-dependent halogenase family protein [Coraliomargarita parva]|uniref:SAM hydrolase/SAM-dependent halogenase family protein n=1 Tax=Coraliomargarita parva TaxID=3014050 RepID=UPI0022B4F39F|nr:S-adenosyl-l-methionine hydroxide adenosyltransferase family protein [Coraliomargarita parva]